MQRTVKPVSLDSVIEFERKLSPELSKEFRGHALYLSTAGPGVQERMEQNLSMPAEAEAALDFEGKIPTAALRDEYRRRILPFLVKAGEGTRERLQHVWAAD